MKIDRNRRYTTIACYACATACLIILFFCLLLRFDSLRGIWQRIMTICSPITTGLIFAYLLNPLMKWYEAHLFSRIERKKNRFRIKRGLSVTLTVLSAVVIIAVFLLGVVPQVISGYNDLCEKASDYISSANEWIRNLIGDSDFLTEQYDKLISKIDAEKLTETLNNLMNNSFDVILKGASSVFDFFQRFLTQAYNIFLGMIIMIYLLLAKERLLRGVNKLMTAVFPDSVRDRIYHVLHKTDTMFGGFIIGKIIDSAIIGVITLFLTWLLRIPYYPLISVIIAVTNVIPCFGPFIGAIPCIFIIFVAEPIKAVWFTILIILIQQLDGNYIGPKILGSKTGLSALGVMLSITIMSGLLGITGLFIGVPVFAVLYALIREAVDKRLTKKGLATELAAYGPSETDGKVPCAEASCTEQAAGIDVSERKTAETVPESKSSACGSEHPVGSAVSTPAPADKQPAVCPSDRDPASGNDDRALSASEARNTCTENGKEKAKSSVSEHGNTEGNGGRRA